MLLLKVSSLQGEAFKAREVEQDIKYRSDTVAGNVEAVYIRKVKCWCRSGGEAPSTKGTWFHYVPGLKLKHTYSDLL